MQVIDYGELKEVSSREDPSISPASPFIDVWLKKPMGIYPMK
jgi:hypothetical protein